MRITAYCTAPARGAVQAALGVFPFTSPPMTVSTIEAALWQQADLMYFRLHGQRGVTGLWYGELPDGSLTPALDIRDGIKTSMIGTVVVIANCYAYDDSSLQGFYRAGVEAVIAGAGQNWAAQGDEVVGTDLLVRWIAKGLRMGLPARGALGLAKSVLWLTRYRLADRDAREFQIVEDKTT